MNWFLSESRYLRFTSFTVYYIAQGLPIGLIGIAMPAWLAEQGVGVGEIASFVAISGLPWAFKLIAGPIMDRYTFLPMGRRRPWIVAAQLGLIVAILSMALVPDPAENVVLLTWVAFSVNCFSAVQDVAVDGMAIDVLPADERGRANSFMAFGQVAGYSVSGALSATMLIAVGVTGAVMVLSVGLGLIFIWGLLVRERTGEKILPWTPGEASSRSLELQSRDWISILKNLNKVFFLKTSLLLILVTFGYRFADGFIQVAAPVIAVRDLGYESTDFSYWFAILSVIAALFGLLLGPVIDRTGAKRIFSIALIGLGITHLVTGGSVSLWTVTYFPLAILALVALFSQAIFISFIALHMTVCWGKVSATQFAIYMAWANLARSIGAGVYGEIESELAMGQEFYIMGICMLLAAFVLSMVKIKKHKEQLDNIDQMSLEGGT
ncbi:MAG: MFS transporter [bacterium]|nr:MFS transporter [Gammaproteobacteria bacterium]HIL95207.1 MFS transporter [Pseudomonadales bacterium]